jgi:hypothetical protein
MYSWALQTMADNLLLLLLLLLLICWVQAALCVRGCRCVHVFAAGDAEGAAAPGGNSSCSSAAMRSQQKRLPHSDTHLRGPG